MRTKTFDIIEDQDGDFYIIEDMGMVFYLADLVVLHLDEINLTVTVEI